MIEKTFTLEVQHTDDGEAFIQFPEETMADLGWKEGDSIIWTDNKDGSFTLSKKETEWVLVECISTFRQRYMVEVPKGKSEWALDTVTMEEAKEFSQKHLGETIVSHRAMSYEDAQKLCLNENDYSRMWTELKRREAFFTEIRDYDK